MRPTLGMGGALLLISLAIAARSENLFSLTIGPYWPQVLLDEEEKRTAWDASLKYGMIIDQRVGFGVGTDFAWNRLITATERDTSGVYYINRSRQSYMFPVFGFVLFDPVPGLLIVHPSIEIQVGYNNMVHAIRDYDRTSGTQGDFKNGYYYGLFVRLQLNAAYDLGESVALTAGFHYTWADMKRWVDDATFAPRNMSGVGLQAGFRFSL